MKRGQSLEGIGMTSERTRLRLLETLTEKGIQRAEVLGALASVPRHLFVDEGIAHRAYEDTVLPIGHEQTISQPFVVARMTEILYEKAAHGRILEIGTGSGYQTAVLAQLWDEVYSVERIRDLHQRAQKLLLSLGLSHVRLKAADGHYGWPEQAPFDAILLTAAPFSIPEKLLRQLGPDGVLLAPVGPQGGVQHLTCVQRVGDEFQSETLDAVRFVPLRQGIQA
jgi:protein-L-isoaspartate(D-aspartate) O-methyltransferase